MSIDMLVWPVLMWHMHGADNNGLPSELLDLVVLTRTGLIVVLMVCVIRQLLSRSVDPVYQAHNGYDPLAGPLQAQVPQDPNIQTQDPNIQPQALNVKETA